MAAEEHEGLSSTRSVLGALLCATTRRRTESHEPRPLVPVPTRRRLHSAHRRRPRPVRLRQVLARRGHPGALGRRLRRVPGSDRPVLLPHGVPRLVHARHHRDAGRLSGRMEEHRRGDRCRVFGLLGRAGTGGPHPRPVRDVPGRAARGGPGDGRPWQGVPHLHARAVRRHGGAGVRRRHPDAEPHGGRHHPGRAHRRGLGRHRHRRRRSRTHDRRLGGQRREARGAERHPARGRAAHPQLRGRRGHGCGGSEQRVRALHAARHGRPVCFVPDGSSHGRPFAARSRALRRRLRT